MVYPCTHPSYIERSCPAFNAAEALTAFGASHPLSEIGGSILVLGHRESFPLPHLLICFFYTWVCMHMPVTIRWQLAGVILSFSHMGSELRPSGLVVFTHWAVLLAGTESLEMQGLAWPRFHLPPVEGKACPAQYTGLQTRALCLVTHGLFVGFGLSQCLDIWFIAIKF